MDKICRVCLLEKLEMIDIFTLDNTDTSLPLFEKIIQCTNVPLARNDSLPEHICLECKNDLNVAYRFRLNVEGSDFILKKFSIDGVNEVAAGQTDDIVEEVEMDDDEENNLNDSSEIYVNYEPEPVRIIQTYHNKSPKMDKDQGKVSTQKPIKDETDDRSIHQKPMEVKTIMTIPKLSKDEKPPRIKGITKQTSPDGTVKTMVRLARSNTTKASKKTSNEQQDINLHVCHECGKAFSKSSALRAHSKRHLSVKPNVCEICNKSFVLPVELKRHLRVHTGEKPYSCRYCDKKFSDFGTRVKHERIHTQEKPFACTYCNKTFTYSNVLKFHIMVHTGEKKYACEHCNKRFIKAHQLKCHLATHGIGTSTKRKSKQQTTSKNPEHVEDVVVSSNEIQTVQVMPTCDPTQTYMLYLKK